ncbi:aromatic-ring-hydroxylating dioxygenase subunit beta [Novosphingobium sp. CCH12-A3]|uniref:aromatic-ring-hydroxylating dioxygenase subunit beta n=1 Tax=Novosphingobium sp. CCH12-A3 TaxID=1768752 RepID=UPI00078232D8|nr:aromatic-ring-hydroxylating dioxygenase subunit beta [Novosphingobium sp. CCH12-A3]
MTTLLAETFRRLGHIVDAETQHHVEHFYYAEAAMLDSRLYDEWLDLFDEDMHYYMPIRRNQTRRNAAEEFYEKGAFAHFDDDINTMRGRIRKATSDLSWCENPGSRTRHTVSNVIVRKGGDPDTFAVSSAFIVYRNRQERQTDFFVGERRDVLRVANTDLGFTIATRTILLDQATVLANNISVFF